MDVGCCNTLTITSFNQFRKLDMHRTVQIYRVYNRHLHNFKKFIFQYLNIKFNTTTADYYITRHKNFGSTFSEPDQ